MQQDPMKGLNLPPVPVEEGGPPEKPVGTSVSNQLFG